MSKFVKKLQPKLNNHIEEERDNKSTALPIFSYTAIVIICSTISVLVIAYTQQLTSGLLVGIAVFSVWHLIIIAIFLNWLNSFVNFNSVSKSKTTQSNNYNNELPRLLPKQLYTLARKIQRNQQKQNLSYKSNSELIDKIRLSLLALQDSVILLNSEGELEWWNQSAENLLQISAEQKNKHIFTVIEADNFRSYFDNFNRFNTVDNLDTEYDSEGVRLILPFDTSRYIQCEMTAVGDETLLILYDVTRMQHLEQMRQDFVANVSHELRTPLTVLTGYIEIFSDSHDINPKWQRGFSLMAQQTKRMNSIVNDLLMLSRLDNEERFTTTCIDMPKLLTSLFDDAQIYNKSYNHLIDLNIDSQKSVLGSETYLTSALLNLITNAIKYTPKGGEIHIAWTAVKDGCVFSVSDNGLGIAPEHVDRLTERFYRVDSGRSRQTGGTGLGLAIVKHVLYQHDATLKIDSTEGQGSTFKVYFPLSKVCIENNTK